MISLDQVYLLEQKVESAVAKIQQLQAENDALRSKCTELTNALSVKSEQLTTFESDQNQIENGIKKALDRLNSIENSVLRTAASLNTNGQAPSFTPQQAAPVQPVVNTPVTPVSENIEPPLSNAPVFDAEPSMGNPDLSFDSMNTINQPVETPVVEMQQEEDTPADFSEDDNQDGLGFDIF